MLPFVHFVGMMLGAAGGFGSALIMRRAVAAGPEAGGQLRALGPMLANVSAVGLALMWASGLVLVWSRWGGPGNLPGLFWLKFAFVLSLTAAAVAIHATYAEVSSRLQAATMKSMKSRLLGSCSRLCGRGRRAGCPAAESPRRRDELAARRGGRRPRRAASG